jgi:pyruvate ferredoxin oxidoreductase delta subunit
MSDSNRLKNWKELDAGGVIVESGNSVRYETGTWRTSKPVWNPDECTHCLTCWVLCPEDAFELSDIALPNGKTRKGIKAIDYFHCKGCGLCVRECPVNKKGRKVVLAMEKEEK